MNALSQQWILLSNMTRDREIASKIFSLCQKFLNLFILCISVFLECIYLYHVHTWWPRNSEMAWPWSCELPCGCWKLTHVLCRSNSALNCWDPSPALTEVALLVMHLPSRWEALDPIPVLLNKQTKIENKTKNTLISKNIIFGDYMAKTFHYMFMFSDWYFNQLYVYSTHNCRQDIIVWKESGKLYMTRLTWRVKTESH